MRRWATTLLGRIAGVKCVAFYLVFLIGAAPIAHAAYHGPKLMVIEAGHLAQHHHHAYVHSHEDAGHHNSLDHDHIVTDIILISAQDMAMPSAGALRPFGRASGGLLLEQLRRPPKGQLV